MPKYKWTAEQRAKISAAQKARWAAKKAGNGQPVIVATNGQGTEIDVEIGGKMVRCRPEERTVKMLVYVPV